jgi:hypothetical protein
MLATIQSRIFSFLFCCPETWKLQYKNCNLALILYGCEIWSLTLREEHRLRAFGNRVLRRIFRFKRNEVTRGWRSGMHIGYWWEGQKEGDH